MGHMMHGKWVNDDRIHRRCARRISCAPTRSFATGSRPTAAPGLPAAAVSKQSRDRYHLFVSYSCPWAHRTIIFRKLKKFEGVISIVAGRQAQERRVGVFRRHR